MYLQTTSFLPLILLADGKGASLYINGVHALHADMKGHAEVYTTMGTGAVYASSTKSKKKKIRVEYCPTGTLQNG